MTAGGTQGVNPAEFDLVGGQMGPAAAERIRRLIDEGQEVTDEFIAELMALRPTDRPNQE